MPKLCEKLINSQDNMLWRNIFHQHLLSGVLKSLQYQIKAWLWIIQQSISKCTSIHFYQARHYLREMARQQIINRQNQEITQVQEGGLTDFIQKNNQQRIIVIPQFERELSESNCTTQIHALQLINQKELETTYFSLEDIETTYSSYPEELNYSFIDESIIQTQ